MSPKRNWAYLPNPPLLQVAKKTDHINQWLCPYAPSLEPSHPGEEGKLINISLGYEVLPLPGPRKIMHKCWPTNLAFCPTSKRRLSDIAALSLSVNHVYTTETLGKELGKEQKTYIMLLKWLKRLLTLCWNITMTKDFLAGLPVERHPPPPPWIILDKQIGPEL